MGLLEYTTKPNKTLLSWRMNATQAIMRNFAQSEYRVSFLLDLGIAYGIDCEPIPDAS